MNLALIINTVYDHLALKAIIEDGKIIVNFNGIVFHWKVPSRICGRTGSARP